MKLKVVSKGGQAAGEVEPFECKKEKMEIEK